MSKTEPGHLAIAKKLADESGRHLSECMQEAADILMRNQRKAQLPKVRALYTVLCALCSILVLNALLSVLDLGGVVPPQLSLLLVAVVLVSLFWITPEAPLMSKLWTRWNTPAFIAAMVFVLFINHPLAHLVNDVALVLFFGVAGLATLNGARHPDRALEKRPYTTKYLFHELSAKDQGRIFFLAPWLSPFGSETRKRR